MSASESIGVVVIGRNEADRLEWSLQSVLAASPTDAVYVDSGSADGSVKIAERLGFRVILLESGLMSAARARQAGWRALETEFVFFLDGDCALQPDFLRKSLRRFDDPRTACVFGLVHERTPERSLFHRMNERYLCPLRYFGDGGLRGGNHLWRRSALVQAGGFDERLFTLENVELGERVRDAGFSVLHVDDPMVVHDLGSFGYGAWFRRARRVGFGAADGFVKIRRPLSWLWGLKDSRETMTQSAGAAVALGAAFLVPSGSYRASLLLAAGWLLLMTARSAWHVRSRCRSVAEALAFGVHETLRAFGFLAGLAEWLVRPRRTTPDWRD